MTRNEKVVEESKELMRSPKNIRNIAIAAHVDHGKSVHGDTLVHLADGSTIHASRLYRLFSEEGEPFNQYEFEGEAYEMQNPPELESYQKDVGELVSVNPIYAVKHETGELYKVTMSDGSQVTLTAEHPFLVLTEDAKFNFTNQTVLVEVRQLLHSIVVMR